MENKLKICKICGNEFLARSNLQVYCQYNCRTVAVNTRSKKIYKVKRKSRLTEDIKWANAVKKRDDFRCQYCGTTQDLNAHHIFGRTKQSTRYDINNGITLCMLHHTFSEEFSAHKTPNKFKEWLKKIKGAEFVDNLKKKADTLIYDL